MIFSSFTTSVGVCDKSSCKLLNKASISLWDKKSLSGVVYVSSGVTFSVFSSAVIPSNSFSRKLFAPNKSSSDKLLSGSISVSACTSSGTLISSVASFASDSSL